MESSTSQQVPNEAAKMPRWHDRLRAQSLVPALAVAVVAIAAVATAVMVAPDRSGAPPAVSRAAPEAVRAPVPVVKAPPLQTPAGPARQAAGEGRMDSSVMGAQRECANCGVVESVAMLQRQNGYQMRIRMDDGSVRTVEQRGALAAGSRVVLERGSVRTMPAGASG